MLRIKKRQWSAPGFALLLCWLLTSPSSLAQTMSTSPASDTLRLSLAQVEQMFLDRNFQLLAQKYQIDIAGAGVTQAGLHANPNVLFMTNLYNPNTNKVLPLRTPSQVDLDNQVYNSGYLQLQVQQLIQLAGKRSKLIALAESNRSLAQLAFRELLRDLRYQLYSTYANLYYDLKALALFGNELARQQRLADSYRVALKTGGIAPFEVTRLDLANRDLQANIANYQSQIADEQATLRVLLRRGDDSLLYPISIPTTQPVLPSVSTALDSALAHRPDVALTQEQIINAERSLSLERARRTPNLIVGADYERYGNAYLNFVGLQLLMDVPIRNRNQGAIKAAELTLKSVGAGLDNQQNLVKSDVLNAYDKLKAYYTLFNSRPPDTLNQSQIQQIATDATRLYNARTIGLLDYLDKIRVYQQAQLNDINLDNNLFQSQQLLNYATNTRFF